MPRLSMVTGIALVVVGAGGYVLSGGVSLTALIPAIIGVLLLVLGFAAKNPRWRKHAMHGAAGLAALGFLGTLRALPDLPELLAGHADRPLATSAQGLTAAFCLIFLLFAVRSFVVARWGRAA